MALGLASCSGREAEAPASSGAARPAPSLSIPAPEVSVSSELPEDYPDVQESIAEWEAINEETIGWISVPGTDISDVVVCRQDFADANSYYLRRNPRGEESFNGCFYADCRIKFDGTVKGMSRNTTIYGHSIEIPDDPNGILFSQLKRYWEEDFARENPYIYFSIDGQDMVWEIFAAYYTNLQYNYIDPMDIWTDEQVEEHIQSLRDRSEYDYDVEVSADDRFLTLSTCLYKLSGEQYPNDFRWVITAKLVQDGQYKEEASLTVNPDPFDYKVESNPVATAPITGM
jgi:sortase B